MTRTTRVPPTEITGIFGAIAKRYTKRKLGEVPESLGVMWHNRPVLKTLMGFFGKAERWDACDTQLKSFAHMAAVAQVGCSACLDFGYLQARDEQLDMDKARVVPRWRESERVHAARARRAGVRRGDDRDAACRDRRALRAVARQLGAPALLELTAFIAAANMVSRSNVALGIESQGFAAACGLPPLATGGRMSDPFVTHRSLLFTVAYEMLGSAADAEDVVQETWLRWADVDRGEVREPRAYLVRIATRLALDRLRTVARRREAYVGVWLPEPLLTSPDVAEDVELAENVSIAMLTVLETLGPVERAVFLLREVFDLPYDEIAEAVGKSGAAVRQIAHRAREHVLARRPRMSVSTDEQQTAVDGSAPRSRRAACRACSTCSHPT